jgi:hypothetical protein
MAVLEAAQIVVDPVVDPVAAPMLLPMLRHRRPKMRQYYCPLEHSAQ